MSKESGSWDKTIVITWVVICVVGIGVLLLISFGIYLGCRAIWDYVLEQTAGWAPFDWLQAIMVAVCAIAIIAIVIHQLRTSPPNHPE